MLIPVYKSINGRRHVATLAAREKGLEAINYFCKALKYESGFFMISCFIHLCFSLLHFNSDFPIFKWPEDWQASGYC